MRSAALALLLGGCLIVRTNEEIVEEPCPTTVPEHIADATGPLVLADAIYFIGANGTLSRLAFDGGPVSELTTSNVRTSLIAADATDLYWPSEGAIVRRPLAGGNPRTIAEGFFDVTALVVDDTSVVWASSNGLDRWSKTDETIESLDSVDVVLGLGAYDGLYYYSDTHGGRLRTAPPATDFVPALYPGPLLVDEGGVYFYEAGESFSDYSGALRLVPREGGTTVTTTDKLSLLTELAGDDFNLYFVTVFGNDYRIKQVSRFGGSVKTLACGLYDQQRIAVAVADDHIYFTDGRGLYRIAKSDTGAR